MNHNFWIGKKILITGHNGFKGSWLVKWLDLMGAETLGYSLKPDQYSFYPELEFRQQHIDACGDIRDLDHLSGIVNDFKPDIVFHLAAQAIVKEAAINPLYTFETNLMGTVNILETLRNIDNVRSIVVITSDKVYENIETYEAYNENDKLSGDEPYSASKVCEEMAAKAYYSLYFKNRNVGIATARASNTYGFGDNHFDRLIPYLIKSSFYNEKVEIRNPSSIRPWQYILDLIRGYLTLAEKLYNNPLDYSQGWNFGPLKDELYTVENVANMITGKEIVKSKIKFREANILLIDSSKSERYLDWKPIYDLRKGLECTSKAYYSYFEGEPVNQLYNLEIERYLREVEEI